MRRPADIEATFRIVTPMFLGGADQHAERLRESSFKGALVFWWRALNYPRLVKDCGGDIVKALGSLKAREQEIFGGQEGQSRVLLRLVPGGRLETVDKGAVLREGNQIVGEGARYFGYGLVDAFGSRKTGTKPGELLRSCLAPGQEFTARLWFRPRSPEADRKEIAEAVKLLGFAGGLGSRVRRGYGSLALASLRAGDRSWQAPETVQGYIDALKPIIEPAAQVPGKDFRITAFGTESRCYVSTTTTREPLRVLSDLAAGMIRYRSWGRNRRYGNIQVEQNFVEDHDWFRVHNGGPDRASDRTAFGLPINYDRALSVSGAWDMDRRASPLMFHVHQLPNGTSFGVVLLLPTKFMPNDEVAISRRNRKSGAIRYDFSGKGVKVLTNFLDGRRPDGTASPGGQYIKLKRIL
jgi:CRISPR-associated protein Cmr1